MQASSENSRVARQMGLAKTVNEAVDVLISVMSLKDSTRIASMDEGEPTPHDQEKGSPYQVWFYDGSFYLMGHCSLANEIRIFALDRIKILHTTDEDFDIPFDFDFDALMQKSFGVFQGPAMKIKVCFDKEIAGYISEKVWHSSQKILEQRDGSIIFEAEVSGTDEVKFWVMSWGSKALVLEPEYLRNEIQSECSLSLDHYHNHAEADRAVG
jgi:predicted DNA-binding transcriptional regulator YafY